MNPTCADVLRAEGVKLVEFPGWRDRGHGDFKNDPATVAQLALDASLREDPFINDDKISLREDPFINDDKIDGGV